MKKILILLFFPLLLGAQTPVPVSSPYIFKKYVTFKDSITLNTIRFDNSASLPVLNKPTLKVKNDTLYFWDNHHWIRLDSTYTLPTASTTAKGGVKIGLYTKMTGDSIGIDTTNFKIWLNTVINLDTTKTPALGHYSTQYDDWLLQQSIAGKVALSDSNTYFLKPWKIKNLYIAKSDSNSLYYLPWKIVNTIKSFLHDSVTVGYGLNQIGPQKFEVDTGKVATLQALIDTSKYKQDTIGTIAANQIVVGNGINKITGNAGIASITANNFTFNNDANKTFGIDASASGTVGRNLTLNSGNSGAGTNLSAGALIHNTGLGTGNAACSQYFGLAKPTTSGTATQTLETYMRLDNDGSLNLQYNGTNSLRFLKGSIPGNGNSLGQIEFGGYWNGSSFVYRAGMYTTALGNWSATNTGARLTFVASAQSGTFGTRFVIDEGWLESKLANYFYWRATALTDANGDKRWFADANYRARFGYRVAGNYVDDVGITNAGILELPTGGYITINNAKQNAGQLDTSDVALGIVPNWRYKNGLAGKVTMAQVNSAITDTFAGAWKLQVYDRIKVGDGIGLYGESGNQHIEVGPGINLNAVDGGASFGYVNTDGDIASGGNLLIDGKAVIGFDPASVGDSALKTKGIECVGINASGLIYSKGTYGEIYVIAGSTGQIISGIATDTLTAFTNNGEYNNCIVNSTRHKITTSTSGRYEITANIDLTGVDNTTYIQLFYDGSEVAKGKRESILTTTETEYFVSLHSIINCAANKDIYIKVFNAGGSSETITVSNASLSINLIGK